MLFAGADEPFLIDAQGKGQLLQFTVSVPVADKAILRVVGQQQLHVELTSLHGPCTVGHYLHPPGHSGDAGAQQRLRPFHLHHAHTAGGVL